MQFTQVSRTGLFHLYLHLTISRINIVELFLARCTEIGFLLRIQIFVQVEDLSLTAQEQTQVVESGILIVAITVAGGIFVQQRRTYQPHTAEVEIVTQRTFLIVYDGVRFAHSLLNDITVTIHHSSPRIFCHQQQPVQCRSTKGHRCMFQHQQHIVCSSLFSHIHHHIATVQRDILQWIEAFYFLFHLSFVHAYWSTKVIYFSQTTKILLKEYNFFILNFQFLINCRTFAE